MLHSAFQATTGISLNTGSGIDAFGPHEPLCLLNILFLFCFFSWSLIFPISFWFFMATSSRPQSLLWFFHWSSSASSRLPLPGLLSWNPSAAAGTLNCQVQTWVQYFWHLLLGFSGVILPIRDVPFTFVSFFFGGHLNLHLSTLSIHRLEVMVGLSWNLVFISLFSGNMKVTVFSVY